MKRIGIVALLLMALLLAALAVGSACAEDVAPTDVSNEAELLAALEDNAQWIRLTEDIQLSALLECDKGVDQEFALDLNGHALSRQLDAPDQDGQVIYVRQNAQISIVNSDTRHRGVISGGYAYEGAGITNDGTAYLSGVTLTGNTAHDPDGSAEGSAIANRGTMYLEDVVVTDNAVVGSDRASAVINRGELYLNDVAVTDNAGGNSLGGLYNDGNLYVSGRLVFSGNAGGDLELANSNPMNVIGPMEADSQINLNVVPGAAITSGFERHNPNLSPDTIFFPADEGLRVLLKGGEAVVREGVDFVERSWNGEQVVAETKTCYDYTLLTSSAEPVTLTDGWYVVNDAVRLDSRLEIQGDVHLILCDSGRISANDGIHVCGGVTHGSFTVYGQFGYSIQGRTTGTGSIMASCTTGDYPAIGGNAGEPTGPITIHGGYVLGYGSVGQPGIGSGSDAPSGTDQPITIYDGVLFGMGGANSSGLGNGNHSSGVRFILYGGYIMAVSGGDDYGAFNLDADPTAPAGKMVLPDYYKVKYQDMNSAKGDAPSAEREIYAQTHYSVTIMACDHELQGLWCISDDEHAIVCPSCMLCESRGAHVLSDIQIVEDRHYAVCQVCGVELGKEHDFGENNLCECGASRIQLTFAPGAGVGQVYSVYVTTLSDFTMPLNPFESPEDVWFAGWRMEGDDKLYSAGESVVFTEARDITITACWSDMTWGVLQNRINAAEDGAVIALTGDVLAEEGDGPLTIPYGKNVTLDLGTYTLHRNLTEPADNGSVIVVDGALTLTGGTVTGGNTTDVGGGVYVNFGGSLNVQSCVITGNHADFAGGGIAIMGGDVSISSGARVSDNTAGETGGGVALIAGSFAMNGDVTVTGNVSNYTGGGVAVLNESTFEVSGAVEIFDNQRKAQQYGITELSDDDIYLGEGNVIKLAGPITRAHPSAVTTEVLAEYGKPVFITEDFTGNGTVEDFASTRPGERILLDEYNGEAVLTVGMVTLRFTPGMGAGEETAFLTPDGTTFTVPDNAYGYEPPIEEMIFSGWHRVGEAEKTVYRPGTKIVLDGDTELVARYTYSWTYLQEMLNAGGAIVLQGDTISMGSSDPCLIVPKGVTVDLDLNGFAIDRNMEKRNPQGCVILVEGDLTLRDSSAAQSGTITGGWLYFGRDSNYRKGSALDINGNFTMYGGNISGNRDEINAVINVGAKGQFLMYGGSVHDNRGNYTVMDKGTFIQYGGDIRNNTNDISTINVEGNVRLEGGSVSYNTSYGRGGAYTCYRATLTVTGGEIIGNVGKTGGGIVHAWLYSSSVICLSGSPVIEGNTYDGGKEGDICLRADSYDKVKIKLVGPLDENVRIGVRLLDENNRVFTENLPGNGRAENFFSHTGDAIALNENGEAMMGTSASLVFMPGEGGKGKMAPMQRVVGMSVTMPECEFTAPEDLMFVAWQSDDGTYYYPGEKLVAREQMTLTAIWARSKWQMLGYMLNLAKGSVIRLEEDLTADESLGDSAITISSDASAILDLNGHTLDRAPVGEGDDSGVFIVQGALTIRDTSDDQTGAILNGSGGFSAPAITNVGHLTIESGTYEGFKTNMNGALILNSGTAAIKGGLFENNTAERGGVIFNESTLTISGGTLENGIASEDGGIIYNSNTLTISGGVIARGKAKNGGAIYNTASGTVTLSKGTVESSWTTGGNGGAICNEGTLNISGGTIRYNLVSARGAHGAAVWTKGTLNLTGGTITLNQCWNRYNYGGGVYVHPESTLNVSGAPKVYDNDYDDIHLPDGVIMNITGALGADARIGLISNLRPTLEDPIEITSGLRGNGEFGNFFTNDETQLPLGMNDEGELVFGAPVTVYFHIDPEDDFSGYMENIYTAYGATITLPEYGYPMPEGKNFVGWEINGLVYHPGETLHITVETVGEVTVLAWATWESTAWSALQAWLNNPHGGTYIMTEDATAQSGDAALSVPVGVTATIDLNGHAIDRGLTDAVVDGMVMVVNGTLTIKDSSQEKTGTITGSKNNGSGGGIANHDTLIIEGGNIRGNSAKEGGAVFNDTSARLNVSGGTMTENSTTDWGGGAIVNFGYMIMRGGTITGNTCVGNGGGIWTSGTLTLYGGTITDNQATRDTSNGGGIYFKEGTLYVGGEPKVLDNLPNNLHMLSGNRLEVMETMGDGADIHVNMVDAPTNSARVVITSGLSGKDLASCFTHDKPDYPVLGDGNGEAVLSTYIIVSYDANGGTGAVAPNVWTIPGSFVLQENPFTPPAGKVFAGWDVEGRLYEPGDTYTFDNATLSYADIVISALWANSDWEVLRERLRDGTKDTFVLTKDITGSIGESYLYIPENRSVTIDLNGHTLNRGMTKETADWGGKIFDIDGELTILDSSPNQTGKITGGAEKQRGGAILVTGKLNLYGGVITGNYAKMNGGGVVLNNNNAVFNMYGGKITGNTTDGTSGGIRVYAGMFNMYGGEISGNSAVSQAGGVFVDTNATFNLYGGTITGNTAADAGGLYANGFLKVSGNPVVTGNTATSSGGRPNIYMAENERLIKVVGALDPSARLGVAVNHEHIFRLTEGLPGNGTRENFTADEVGYNIWMAEDGELEIGMRSYLAFDPGEGGSGTMPDILIENGEAVIMPACGFTAPEGKQFLCWKLDDDNGTMCNAGEVYTPTTFCTATAMWDVSPDSPWATLQQLINAATGKGEIELWDDITARPIDPALSVPTGVNVTIDLKGHTLNRALTTAQANGSVFIIDGGTLTIKDSSAGETGRVTGGKTTGSGGGVCVTSGTLNLYGGAITGNEADNSWGGGVYLDQSAVFNLGGGVISGNNSGRNGGGVHVSERAVLNVSGSGVVRDNLRNGNANNVNLASGALVHVTGRMEESARICVSTSVAPTESSAVPFTTGIDGKALLSNFRSDRADGMVKFTVDGEAAMCVKITIQYAAGEGATGSMPDSTYVKGEEVTVATPAFTAPEGKIFTGWLVNDGDMVLDTGETLSVEDDRLNQQVNTLTAVWSTSEWAALNARMAKAANGPVTIRLTKNTTATSSDEALSVPAGTTVTLDLNGFTLSRGLSSARANGQVIIANGTLNLMDSSASQSGLITGGYNLNEGGGITIAPGGCLNMYGGTISGNEAKNAFSSGWNLDSGAGGGVYIYKGARMNMYGGTITNNQSYFTNAAVYLDDDYSHSGVDPVLTLGGSAKIYGNKGTTSDGTKGSLNGPPCSIKMTPSKRLTLNGPLNSDALIEVSCVDYFTNGYPNGSDMVYITSGLAGYGSPSNFTCFSSEHTVVMGPNGEAVIVRKQAFPLSGFAIPAGVTEIEEEAFAGLPIGSAFIPDSCRVIGPGAFRDCRNLRRVSLPMDCVIDDTAFEGVINSIWFFMPEGGTTQQWAEQYALSHNCVVYPLDD